LYLFTSAASFVETIRIYRREIYVFHESNQGNFSERTTMKCYLSTGSFQTRNLEQIISLSLEHDFNLELSSALPFSPSTRATVCNAAKRLNFLVHNYFPSPQIPFVLNLASSDPEIHQQSVKLCQNAIDLCVTLGAPFYSVHAGFALNLRPIELGDPMIQGRLAAEQSISRDAAYETFVTTIENLALYAAARNVGLLVENNVLARENLADDGSYPQLLADVNEVCDFFSDVSDTDTGLLLDTGHAKVSALTLGITPERYLEELMPFIGCLHLSDNNGQRDTNSPLTGDAWFAPFLKELSSVPMVIEVYNLSLNEMYQQRELVAKLTTIYQHSL
jgi:sugar phosphate isomerase/epimerase